MSRFGTSQHSAATQQLRRFRSEAGMHRIYEYAPLSPTAMQAIAKDDSAIPIGRDRGRRQ